MNHNKFNEGRRLLIDCSQKSNISLWITYFWLVQNSFCFQNNLVGLAECQHHPLTAYASGQLPFVSGKVKTLAVCLALHQPPHRIFMQCFQNRFMEREWKAKVRGSNQFRQTRVSVHLTKVNILDCFSRFCRQAMVTQHLSGFIFYYFFCSLRKKNLLFLCFRGGSSQEVESQGIFTI